jgi:hypothetical protein
MPFSEKARQYDFEVAKGRCRHLVYSEKKGFQRCPRKAKQDHHITPEGWTKVHGGNPDETIGMPLCNNHHVKNHGTEEYSEDFAYHTDIASAYDNYSEWKRQHGHMEVTLGRRIPRSEMPSPFEEVVGEHKRLASEGVRYHNGTPEQDRYYEEDIRTEMCMYNAENKVTRPIPKRKVSHKPMPTNYEWLEKETGW